MILKGLTFLDHFNGIEGVPNCEEHCLITGTAHHPYRSREHLTGLGILSMLSGKGSFRLNGTNYTLDGNSFLITGRGSWLSFSIPKGVATPILLFFDTEVSRFVAQSVLFNSPGVSPQGPSDFSLVEHIHFTNATLKDHLTLLVSLGDSCASLYALKADMVVRSILDDLIEENYNAFRVSKNLPVIKNSTRVDLYKRLAAGRDWMERNYSSPGTLDGASDVAMLNREHFLRMFKQAYGITPHQYILGVRLEKARLLLETTDESVISICERVGFESPSTFSTLFKSRSGEPPARHRLKFRRTN